MVEIGLDSQLWHACAGEMVQMPSVNSKIFYFPQGHAEHTLCNVDFTGLPNIPPLILCRVAAVKFLADVETDEVYARIRLVPVPEDGFEDDGEELVNNGDDKSSSFAKTLTQSDANNGGGFSVPRYCAETIFPMLDYAADPPVQTIVAKDVLGQTWKFRHIYRGTPRRHLLTTGWSSFINQKKLAAGDSIVFLKTVNRDLCVGIRRAKRGGISGPESPSRSNIGTGNYGSSGLRGWGKSRPESVLDSVSLATSGQPFEVMYYPRASTPEFFVKASSVSAAMRLKWCTGMRFKMPFNTEDSSRITWFMGTIDSIQVSDPITWPTSPWKLLQVTWDEPELMNKVKQVNPWLVELLTDVPVIHPPSFSPPRKKLRLPQLSDVSPDGHLWTPSVSGNPFGPSSLLCCQSDSVGTAGIQGVRHAQLGFPLPDLHLSNNLDLGLLSHGFDQLSEIADDISQSHHDSSKEDDVSCVLTMGSPTQTECVKTPRFLLFGQPILTEQQLSNQCCSDGSVTQPVKVNTMKAEKCGLDWKVEDEDLHNTGFPWNRGLKAVDLSLNTSHCKVFWEYENVGKTIDLSVLRTYNELYKRLGNMFGIEKTEIQSHVFYFDAAGTLKHIGEEPFSHFMKTAKRLTISSKSGGNSHGRKWITDLTSTKRGLESANQTGPPSIFA